MSGIYTVGEITSHIKDVLECELPFLWVRGQISNLARPSSGHIYFSLKDEKATLNVVWFKFSQRGGGGGLGFDPLTGEVHEPGMELGGPGHVARNLENGQEVMCGGRITVYPPRGAYQLKAELVQDVGVGQLHLEFEALKKKFLEKGYFTSERKRALPAYPTRVAVITAPTGAAIQDFLRLSGERGWGGEIRIYPSLVQGNEAEARIAGALDLVNEHAWADVIVLIRGGGSLEDLWAFNTEAVAEAVYRSDIPVLAGIGHEVDTSIADMIADVRAATPSHAAQLLWPERNVLAQEVDALELVLTRSWGRCLGYATQRLDSLEKELALLAPLQRLERLTEQFGALEHQLIRAFDVYFEKKTRDVEHCGDALTHVFGPHALLDREHELRTLGERLQRAGAENVRARTQQLDMLELKLGGLDPQLPLERGYSMVLQRDTGRYVRSVSDVKPGDRLDVVVKDGRVLTNVTGTDVITGTEET